MTAEQVFDDNGYAAARAEATAEYEDHKARMLAHARLIAERFSGQLPDGLRLEYNEEGISE